jgi:acyl-coenzyme A synthetase/AMP-(fatty) acid ligase/3-hydroxymyristoyl/3-hydroxydecanoyl-(acyl carrier protein) dehydratase
MSGASVPDSVLLPLHRLFAHGRTAQWPVCIVGPNTVDWQTFSRRVADLAALFAGRSEQRWALFCADPCEFCCALFALWHAGRQPIVPANFQPGTLAATAAAVDAAVADDAMRSVLTAVSLPVVMTTAASKDAPGEFGELDPHTTRIELFTSGSTGEPKCVAKSLAQFDAEIAVHEAMWGEAMGDAVIAATVPHHHIYGLLFRLLWPLSAGRRFATAMLADPGDLQARLAQWQNIVLVSSPAMLARLPGLIALTTLRPAPKCIFSSGGPLPAAAAAEFRRHLGQAPTEIFGSTESGGIAWRRQQAGDAAWTPLPGVAVDLREDGALQLRSPFLADAQPLRMEDAAEIQADGRFVLKGRLDSVVKIEGKRLSLADMNERLRQHAWVRDAAAVALSGAREMVGAVVALNHAGQEALARDGSRSVTQTLGAHLAGWFDRVLLPRRWQFPEALPYNERGKLTRDALAALFDRDGRLLPEIISERRDGNRAIISLRVPLDLVYFAGHFPGLPVLPGVVQIHWAIRFARRYLAADAVFSALENVKFHALVLPDTELELQLEHAPGSAHVNFTYASEARKFSSGRVVFGGAP